MLRLIINKFHAKCETKTAEKKDTSTQIFLPEDDSQEQRDVSKKQRSRIMQWFDEAEKKRGFKGPFVDTHITRWISNNMGFPLGFLGLYIGIGHFKVGMARGEKTVAVMMLANGTILAIGMRITTIAQYL